MSNDQTADDIAWDGPGGVQSSLRPEPGGTLQVEVQNGVVTVTGKKCLHLQGENARRPKDVACQVLDDVHLTIITPNCQITWKTTVEGQSRTEE